MDQDHVLGLVGILAIIWVITLVIVCWSADIWSARR